MSRSFRADVTDPVGVLFGALDTESCNRLNV